MKSVPNNTITTLLRCLPIIIESIDRSKCSTRLQNAIRLTNIELSKLQKLQKMKEEARTKEQAKTKVYFAGVDYWSRPVFKDINRKSFYCDVNHLVNGNIKEEELLGYYQVVGTAGICYKGNDFDSEPMGDPANVEILTREAAFELLKKQKEEKQ